MEETIEEMNQDFVSKPVATLPRVPMTPPKKSFWGRKAPKEMPKPPQKAVQEQPKQAPQLSEKLDVRDVGMAEDMIFLLKNLIASEDHAALSFNIAQDNKWIEVLDIVRKIRTKYLAQFVKQEKSQLWCLSKHILAASEGMIEVANRFNQMGKTQEAKEALKDSSELVSLLLILNDYEGGKNATVKTSA